MTDEQIDRLSGRKLREAVALSLGWTVNEFGGWLRPGMNRRTGFPVWHTDQGAALGLLMTISGVSIEWGGMFIIVKSFCGAVADGLITEAAAVMCRAYLKLKN